MATRRSYIAIFAAARPLDRSCERLVARVSLFVGVGTMGSLNKPALGLGTPD